MVSAYLAHAEAWTQSPDLWGGGSSAFKCSSVSRENEAAGLAGVSSSASEEQPDRFIYGHWLLYQTLDRKCSTKLYYSRFWDIKKTPYGQPRSTVEDSRNWLQVPSTGLTGQMWPSPKQMRKCQTVSNVFLTLSRCFITSNGTRPKKRRKEDTAEWRSIFVACAMCEAKGLISVPRGEVERRSWF